MGLQVCDAVLPQVFLRSSREVIWVLEIAARWVAFLRSPIVVDIVSVKRVCPREAHHFLLEHGVQRQVGPVGNHLVFRQWLRVKVSQSVGGCESYFSGTKTQINGVGPKKWSH